MSGLVYQRPWPPGNVQLRRGAESRAGDRRAPENRLVRQWPLLGTTHRPHGPASSSPRPRSTRIRVGRANPRAGAGFTSPSVGRGVLDEPSLVSLTRTQARGGSGRRCRLGRDASPYLGDQRQVGRIVLDEPSLVWLTRAQARGGAVDGAGSAGTPRPTLGTRGGSAGTPRPTLGTGGSSAGTPRPTWSALAASLVQPCRPGRGGICSLSMDSDSRLNGPCQTGLWS
jgi:hypothetical protein